MSRRRLAVSLRWILVLMQFAWGGTAMAGAPAPAPAETGPHPEHQLVTLGDFKFESGEVVKDFKMSFVTHGKLNRAKSNVILMMQPGNCDHHCGDFLIGPGKGLDTEKYFIVATDHLGNAMLRHDVTTGPTNSGLRMSFPRYTLRDSVNLEYRLLKDYFGFEQVLAVIGGSTGANKSYQFAVSYPTYMKGAIPIAGSTFASPTMRWLWQNDMDIIALDPGWHGGRYETNPRTGLAIALMRFPPLLYTHRWLSENVRTPAQQGEFHAQWRRLLLERTGQDARDKYYEQWSLANFDVGDSPGFKGDRIAALRSIKAHVLIIAAKEDLIFPPDEADLARKNIPKAKYLEIDSPLGHLICVGSDPEATKVMDREIAKFLSELR